MSKTARSAAPRGERREPSNARYLGRGALDASLDVTLVLRRKGPLNTMAQSSSTAARRADFATHCGADPSDMERLRQFSRKRGLDEVSCDLARRTLHLRGTVKSLQQAFNVQLGRYQLTPGGAAYVSCVQAPTLPDPSIIAVLGLDRRPIARPHFRVARAQSTTSFTPLQVGQLYDFPTGTDGSGQIIAIIELGGGYRKTDLKAYFKSLGLATPSIAAVGVDGARNQPGGAADAEVMLDIEVAGALAPKARLVVYFAANTDQGFYNAISMAAHNST
ncbi:MAG: protease pro-enzyme activation domain-containing protein, partial [Rhodanobacter sp.]